MNDAPCTRTAAARTVPAGPGAGAAHARAPETPADRGRDGPLIPDPAGDPDRHASCPAVVHLENGFFVTDGGYEHALMLMAATAALALTGSGEPAVDRLLPERGLGTTRIERDSAALRR